jgi:hypothetical protein
MLYFIIRDNYKPIDNNKLINPKNVIFIEKKYNNPIKILLLICKKLKPTDIICFIDQPNTIILEKDTDILKKYQLLIKEKKVNKSKILFSRLKKPSNIYEKYNQDKKFPRFGKFHIDTRLFIGNTKSIIKFWSVYDKSNMINNKNESNDVTTSYHSFVHKMALYPFSKTLINIDIKNEFFCNYSQIDSIIFNDKIVINNKTPPIVSGYELYNPITAKKQIFKFGKSYTNKFYDNTNGFDRIELILLILSLILMYMTEYKLLALVGVISIFNLIIHYQIFVKHQKSSYIKKIIYAFADFIHMSLLGFMFYLSLNYECDIKKTLILNTLYLGVILTFFIFKRCVLTIIENRILGIDTNYASMSIKKRISYFFSLYSKYELIKGNPTSNSEQWMKSNMYTIGLIILSNIYCLIRIMNKTTNITTNI